MVRLKFVFANHDGVHVEQEQEIKKSILDVKEDLIAPAAVPCLRAAWRKLPWRLSR